MFEIILLVPLMAVLARAAGGGLFATRLPSFLPEVLFGLFFGVVFHMLHGGGTLAFLVAAAWSYGWMETGHGTAYTMGRQPATAQSGRKQTLSRVIDPLCAAVGAPLGGRFYCWAFMGLKGALIGLPVAPAGLLLAFLWPAAYEAGWALTERFPALRARFAATELGEWLTGASAGLILALAL